MRRSNVAFSCGRFKMLRALGFDTRVEAIDSRILSDSDERLHFPCNAL